MRTTRKQLEALLSLIVQLGILPTLLGKRRELDHYQPGMNPYTWALVLVHEDRGYAESQYFNERFSAQEMRALLKGILFTADVQRWMGIER